MKNSMGLFHALSVLSIVCMLESCGTSESEKISALENRIKMLERKVQTLERGPMAQRVEKLRELAPIRAMVKKEIDEIAVSARLFLAKHRTYTGYILPENIIPSNGGFCSTSPSDTNMVIEVTPPGIDGKISASLNRAGALVNWKYTGAFAGLEFPKPQITDDATRHIEGISQEMMAIAENAKIFQSTSTAMRLDGSIAKYEIPDSQSSTLFGWYFTVPCDQGIAIEGYSKKYLYIRRITLDSAGRVVQTDSIRYAGMERARSGNNDPTVDSLRQVISADFKTLASRAKSFRSLPSNAGGGGGKYTGYQSAQVASMDGLVQYHLSVDPDVILLRAHSVRGLGEVSAKIDAQGNLNAWYYNGELAK